ncbi:MAG: SRPBCC family protein [Myxococcota bacterium]|nr:SRPBCC family protein [Myxococcota bacterium]
MKTVTQTVDIDVTPERFYTLLTDFESYPDFVPNQSSVALMSVSENRWRVQFELSVVRKLKYTLDLVGVPGQSLKWYLVEGDMMKTNTGGWTLESLESGGTRAHYEIDVTFAGFVPRSVARTLIERTLPSNLAAFKREAERRGA